MIFENYTQAFEWLRDTFEQIAPILLHTNTDYKTYIEMQFVTHLSDNYIMTVYCDMNVRGVVSIVDISVSVVTENAMIVSNLISSIGKLLPNSKITTKTVTLENSSYKKRTTIMLELES